MNSSIHKDKAMSSASSQNEEYSAKLHSKFEYPQFFLTRNILHSKTFHAYA